jgi:Rrf2 family protein
MHLNLGRRADYAVRAVLDLARHWESPDRRKSRSIAEEMVIPAKYLPQVLTVLVRAGIVDSVSGPDGGYRLAEPPEEITLLDVIEAVEGPLGSSECVLRGGPCHWEGRCAIHEPWAEAQEALVRRLDATTFADLALADAVLEDHRG